MALKEALCNPPVLALPDLEHDLCIQCDASDVAIAAVLS